MLAYLLVGILRMGILRMLGKMLDYLPVHVSPGSWATKYVGQQITLGNKLRC